MSFSYSDISELLSEAKKKKPLTTGDCDAPEVDDSVAKITEGFPKVKGTLNPWEDPKTGKSDIKVVKDKNVKGGTKEATKKELTQESAAWTRKEGKNKSGGLNEKGRKSYERENPGSDLKAPSKEKGNKRRASFCARMKGMKKKLTSAKTANDPDSRINKSLRAWNC